MKPIFLLFLGCFSVALFSAVPLKLESAYSEALIAYNTGQHDQAKKLYEIILKEDPNQIETLRLKALSHKALQETADAVKVYRQLIKIEQKEDKPKREYAPYYFEIGTLAFQQKNYPVARYYLLRSIDADFNIAASNFFIGMANFEEKKWESARNRFEKVIAGDVDDLKPSTQLYLAQISDQMNDAAGTMRGYVEAKEIAEEQISSDGLPEATKNLARRVMTTADKELRNYDKSALFGDIGLSSGYDTNVLSVPKGTVDAGGTQPASFKETISYTIGYSTSPTKQFQFLGTYRGNTNYNFNRETRTSQYLNQDVALFVTRFPYRVTNYGAKIGGTGALQYQVDSENNGKYAAYNLTGTVGLFGRLAVGRGWILGADTNFMPTKVYTDTTVGETLARSGWTENTRVYLTRERPTTFLNPGLYLTGEYAQPNGTEYQSRKLGLDFGNTMYLTSRLILGQTIGFADVYYPNRPSEIRNDQMFTAAMSFGWNATNMIMVLLDASYLENLSNISNYRYNRLSASISGLCRF